MLLLSLIITKNYMCILWDRKYIVFLCDNKQNRNMSSYQKKIILVDAFGFVSVVTSLTDVFPWLLILSPLRNKKFFPFGYITCAGCSCSSLLIIPHPSCSPGCARAGPSEETCGWRDRQGWVLTLFSPDKLVQHHEKSLQITQTSLGRE